MLTFVDGQLFLLHRAPAGHQPSRFRSSTSRGGICAWRSPDNQRRRLGSTAVRQVRH